MNRASVNQATVFFVLRLNEIVNTMSVNVSLARTRYPAIKQSRAIIGLPAKSHLNLICLCTRLLICLVVTCWERPGLLALVCGV